MILVLIFLVIILWLGFYQRKRPETVACPKAIDLGVGFIIPFSGFYGSEFLNPTSQVYDHLGPKIFEIGAVFTLYWLKLDSFTSFACCLFSFNVCILGILKIFLCYSLFLCFNTTILLIYWANACKIFPSMPVSDFKYMFDIKGPFKNDDNGDRNF